MFWNWFGGYFDGEGSINISYNNKNNVFQPRAEISTTDKRVMLFLKDNLNIGTFNLEGRKSASIINSKTYLPYNSKLQYYWRVSNKMDLEIFSENIKDYLIEKHKQVYLLMKFLKFFKKKRTNEENDICIKIASRISHLNKE